MGTKVCRRCQVEKPVVEFNKLACSADGLSWKCRPCRRSVRNNEGDRARSRAHLQANREAELVRMRKRYLANKESNQAACKAWRAVHVAVHRDLRRAWDRRNPALRAFYRARRHAAKKHRTPPWLTAAHFEQMQWYYWAAEQLAQETGVPHAVDHIIPLQGKLVSGLHVPWNLQVLTETENSRKGNRFDPL